MCRWTRVFPLPLPGSIIHEAPWTPHLASSQDWYWYLRGNARLDYYGCEYREW